jgi:hypothetical protein
VLDYSGLEVEVVDLGERNLAYSTLMTGYPQELAAGSADDPLPRVVAQYEREREGALAKRA